MARQLVNDAQISALVPSGIKAEVQRLAEYHNVSEGEVIRAALEVGLPAAAERYKAAATREAREAVGLE